MLAVVPRAQECRVLATGERPGLLETHFFSSVEFPSTPFSLWFFSQSALPRALGDVELWLRSWEAQDSDLFE